VLARRRAREVLLVGERYEVAQLAKFHKRSL
jgi:hypothetical protein